MSYWTTPRRSVRQANATADADERIRLREELRKARKLMLAVGQHLLGVEHCHGIATALIEEGSKP